MKLLVISNNPDRPSFRQRIGIYLGYLNSSGIECEVVKLPANYSRRYVLYRRAAQFDAVFLHKKCLNFFDSLWLRHYSNKIIFDFDDAIMYCTSEPDNVHTSHFRLFRRTAKLADMILAGNGYLLEHALAFNKNVHLLPTGLDIEPYTLSKPSKDVNKVRLVWIGSKSTLRYMEEIRRAIEKVALIYPDVVLRIICNDFLDFDNVNVERCLWSLDSQVEQLALCDIGLSPLPDDKFTKGKCGFKILQYQACGLPVVTSPVGVNTDFVNDGESGFAAQTIEEWVDKLSLLIEDRQLREKMGARGFENAAKHDVRVIGPKLAELIKLCL